MNAQRLESFALTIYGILPIHSPTYFPLDVVSEFDRLNNRCINGTLYHCSVPMGDRWPNFVLVDFVEI